MMQNINVLWMKNINRSMDVIVELLWHLEEEFK